MEIFTCKVNKKDTNNINQKALETNWTLPTSIYTHLPSSSTINIILNFFEDLKIRLLFKIITYNSLMQELSR